MAVNSEGRLKTPTDNTSHSTLVTITPSSISPSFPLPPPSVAEQRLRLSADERREYYDEQRNEFENYVEEERDEQDERTREKTEQWREFHYDGLYPRYPRGW
ncbi:unique cartilage matrix-associated protein-like [Oncorhynchus tshawytscha]|uniref:unique cartilage matrix-associated protein-like n=1 Tax=Oncorhynchus tshawytscha TaxID=74940 RepID=UPI001C3C2D10|nr:unique cartilage matrix-associated protein-like [Oncorhynchus tshawytscha]